VACWAVLFDLLDACPPFRNLAGHGKISFAVNHLMVGPINKALDLVVCIPRSGRRTEGRSTFVDLATQFGMVLTQAERDLLNAMPVVYVDRTEDVSQTVIALEAKACMTDLVGSIPRLHAEILATGFIAKQAEPTCITASYTLVNGATTFKSPGTGEVKTHSATEAERVMAMIRAAVPKVQHHSTFGYDAVGASLIKCANDGSAVTVLNTPPAPSVTDFFFYDRMINAICAQFNNKIAHFFPASLSARK
jgi:hypothetical protein